MSMLQRRALEAFSDAAAEKLSMAACASGTLDKRHIDRFAFLKSQRLLCRDHMAGVASGAFSDFGRAMAMPAR